MYVNVFLWVVVTTNWLGPRRVLSPWPGIQCTCCLKVL